MKKYRIAFLAVFAMFFFTSCEDLLDVEEEFSFSIEFTIDTDETSFSASKLFDLSDDVDLIDEYGNKIKEINLDEIYVQITDHEGDINFMIDLGLLSVSEADGSNKKEISSIGSFNLSELVNNPMSLVVNQAGADLLEDLAKNPPHRLMLHYEIEISEAHLPINFDIKFEFNATMVANPLN